MSSSSSSSPVYVYAGGVHGLAASDGGLAQTRLRLLQHLQGVPEPNQHPFTSQVRLHLHQLVTLVTKNTIFFVFSEVSCVTQGHRQEQLGFLEFELMKK
jgi:hypothetical protein